MDILAQILARYDSFSVTPINKICDRNQIFTQLHAKADRMDANFDIFTNL